MYKIKSQASSQKKNSTSSFKMITSLDSNYEEEEENFSYKNKKESIFAMSELYEEFQIQMNEEFFILSDKNNIKKISSNNFVPHRKSIFAPDLINSSFSVHSLKKDINTLKNSKFKIEEKEDAEENLIMPKFDDSNTSHKTDNTSIKSESDTSFFKSNNSIKIKKSLNSDEILKPKMKSVHQITKELSQEYLSLNLDKRLKTRSLSSHFFKENKSAEDLLRENCILCNKGYFPKTFVSKIICCKKIFHSNCLVNHFKFQRVEKNSLTCPKCLKILYK